MLRILQSHGFAAIAGVLSYLAVTVVFWPTLRLPVELPVVAAKAATQRGPSWDFTNPEVDQLVTELKSEKAALAERQNQLNELAARLQTEQMELSAVTQSVHQLRRELDETVVRVADEETANLKKLARVYAVMSPDGAAAILKQLDEATIVKIMAFMKEDESAPVLETLAKQGEIESKLAASISERLRLVVFRKPPEKRKS